MRILFATTHTHLPQGTGGLEINTHVLCQALIATGHEAQVFCALQDTPLHRSRRMVTKLFGRMILSDTRLGYPVHRARYPQLSVSEAVAVAKPDIVVAQGWNASELAQAISAVGIRAIVYAHNAQRFGPTDAPADIIANSRFTASLHNPSRVLGIVPPLIEPDAYRVSSSRETVLFVNPIPQKGLAIALALARSRPDIQFDFYEAWRLSPKERSDARRLTSDLANVSWHAAIPDMRAAYGRARLVLFPSAMETWGRVASEAHISGIPTLGSDRGALPDTIGPAGLCVPFGSPSSDWSRALSMLWDDPKRYDAYVRQAQLYSQRREITPAQVLAHFIELLEGRHAHRTEQRQLQPD